MAALLFIYTLALSCLLATFVDLSIIDSIGDNLSPGTITYENISFLLYTRTYNGTNLTRENLDVLDSTLPTVFIVHGWAVDVNDPHLGPLANAYLQKQDANVIIVDYDEVAYLWYTTSVSLASDVASLIADFIVELVNNYSISLDTMELTGHSLGAQIIGYVGRFVRNETGSLINRLNGLDPAGPLFSDLIASTDNTASGDAALVLCVHTDAGVYGTTASDCDFDFYPNGGTAIQPDCIVTTNVKCNHEISWDYFTEAVGNSDAFLSTQCDSWLSYSAGSCCGNGQVTIGGDLKKEDGGKYYLSTNSDPPYSES